jgi:hypothetical protein
MIEEWIGARIPYFMRYIEYNKGSGTMYRSYMRKRRET